MQPMMCFLSLHVDVLFSHIFYISHVDGGHVVDMPEVYWSSSECATFISSYLNTWLNEVWESASA